MNPAEPREQRSPLLQLAALLIRHLRVFIGLPLAAMFAAALVSLLLPERYTVASRFIPEGGSEASRLSGLAAQFGFEIGAAEAGEPLDFYVELLESRELLRTAVLTEYRFADEDGDTLSGDLLTLLRPKGEESERRIRNAVRKLEDLVAVGTDPESRILTLDVSAPWPELAILLNRRLLELVSEFNLERRQSRAAAEREFLEARLTQALTELTGAEAALQRFLSDNRRYTESPQLAFEHNRLSRQVDLRQQLYTSLAQAYEQARVDEVRNTPVITILDPPRGPADQTAPRILVNAVLGLLLGFLLAAAWVVVTELLAVARRQNPEEFERLSVAARRMLRPRRTRPASAAGVSTERAPRQPPIGRAREEETIGHNAAP